VNIAKEFVMEPRNEYGTDVSKLFGGVDPLAPRLKRAPDDELGDEEEEEEADEIDEDEDEFDDADFDEEDDDELLDEDEEED
jgi:hypothetical protein